MGEVGLHNIFQGTSIFVYGWHDYGRRPLVLITDMVMVEVMAHNIFNGTILTVNGWNGYELGWGS